MRGDRSDPAAITTSRSRAVVLSSRRMNGTTKGPKWAVYHAERFWLTDTCVQGAWSETVEEATWFDSRQEASDALIAAEIYSPVSRLADLGITLCRVR
jgi:hypothetical protein